VYGTGFLDGAVGAAQDNLSGFLESMAPPAPSPDYQAPDISWGVQPYSNQGSWGIPAFDAGSSWGVPGFSMESDYRLPSLVASLGSVTPPAQPKPAQPQQSSSAVPPIPTSSPLYGLARNAATAAQIDPDLFVNQINVESNFNPYARSAKGGVGIAQIVPQYHPGVNADDPAASLVYAAQLMSRYMKKYGGQVAWALAAYNAGEGAADAAYANSGGGRDLSGLPPETRDYIKRVLGSYHSGASSTAVASPVPGQYPSNPATPPQDPLPAGGGNPTNWGGYTPATLVPNQLNEGLAAGFNREKALAICGPAAAVAFERAYGHAPGNLAEATEAARIQGLWDQAVGMHGPAAEVALMKYLGVPAHQEAVDWNKIAQEVMAGRPVALSTGQHYFVATGYNPANGTFEFGQSAGVIRASGGHTQYTPGQLGGLGMGLPVAAIYMDQ
jgi:hypothetical protein